MTMQLILGLWAHNLRKKTEKREYEELTEILVTFLQVIEFEISLYEILPNDDQKNIVKVL